MIIKVQCQICYEIIGIADTDKLALPIRGSMFESKDPAHGFPAPFPPDVDWEFMRCPYGAHRPFIEPDVVPYRGPIARVPEKLRLGEQGATVVPWDPPGGCVQAPEPEEPNLFPTGGETFEIRGGEAHDIAEPPKKRGRKPKKSALDKIMEEGPDVST